MRLLQNSYSVRHGTEAATWVMGPDVGVASCHYHPGCHRSGTPTTPNARRTRPMVTLTLSPEALARLEAIASERGTTANAVMQTLFRIRQRLMLCVARYAEGNA